MRGPWITGVVLPRRRSRQVPRRLAAHRRRRLGDRRTGYVMISDRSKDVIKSGGEWVSSVDLENTMMGHPDVLEAAVIGVPDDRWDERPLACVVRKAGSGAHRRRVARAGSPSAPPSSGCPSDGRSSTRCPRPASASSTRRCSARATRPTTLAGREARLVRDRRRRAAVELASGSASRARRSALTRWRSSSCSSVLAACGIGCSEKNPCTSATTSGVVEQS